MGHKEEEDSKDFQTAHKHIEAQQPFACWQYAGKITCGSHTSHTGTCITQHGDAGTQTGIHVQAQEAMAGCTQKHKEQIRKEERHGATHLFLTQDVTVDPHIEHGTRMQLQNEFVEQTLGGYDGSQHLESATRTACTGTDGHDKDGGTPEESSPCHIVKLLSRKSRTAHDGGHMEERRTELLFQSLGNEVLGAVGRCIKCQQESEKQH